MYVNIRSLITGQIAILEDVASCSYDGVEFTATFKVGHKYTSIDEILECLPQTEECNFHFKGVDAWDYLALQEGLTWANGHEIKLREDGSTDLLAVLRDARVVIEE